MQETQYIMGSLDHPRHQSFPLYSKTGQEYITGYEASTYKHAVQACLTVTKHSPNVKPLSTHAGRGAHLAQTFWPAWNWGQRSEWPWGGTYNKG